jgi:hypothetical protein
MTRSLLPLLVVCLLASPSQGQDDRTFADWDVERARAFWTESAGGELDCLETLNEALRVLYGDRTMRLKSTVDLTMKALRRIGRAGPPIVLGFFDPDGRKTRGVTQPETLRKSVWDTMLEAAEGQPPGWHLFGFSPLDGYHSIVLSLDTRNPNEPKVYWSDQWGSKGGFKLYATREELDGEIESLTSSWWRGRVSSTGVKFKSDAKLYPLIPAKVRPAETLAEIHRLPAGMGVPIHTEPTLGYESALRNAEGHPLEVVAGQTLELVGRRGQWVKVRLGDGQEGWVHAHFVRLVDRDARARVGAIARVSEATGD